MNKTIILLLLVAVVFTIVDEATCFDSGKAAEFKNKIAEKKEEVKGYVEMGKAAIKEKMGSMGSKQ
ncbi:unnamed protein product [Oppiella nova]|uniref:Uncharacterized protein n=1 Tax=Oppiella nova TaxID=334625 RepID=A0A7R9QQS9_9ACAR|nr:unnamed protein product [Oppiella nova]CAG2171650.1 unnamed protein product [Oppiella nova]